MSDISQLPDDIRALIAGEDAAAPTGDRGAVRDRVLTSVGVGVAAGTVAATTTTASAAAASTTAASAGGASAGAAVAGGLAGKLAIVALTVGAIGGGAVLVSRDKPAASTHVGNAAPVPPPPAVTSSPAPAPSVQRSAAPQIEVVPDRPLPQPRAVKRAAVEVPVPPPPTPPVDDEPTLLHRAWDALGHGDTATALASVELDAKLYPSGALAEERDALHIDILLRLSRTDEARALARDFSARYPDSIHGDLITRALGDPR